MAGEIRAGRVTFKTDDFAIAGGVMVVVALAAWAWSPIGVALATALLILVVLGAARDVRRALDDHDRQVEARLWLSEALEVRAPLPPMRGWAMSPDLAREVVEHVLDARPARVVECGSGVSTLLVAYALERTGGGRVVALEHDAEYAARTAERIRLHGLEAVAEVVHAPLQTVEVEGEAYRWYAAPDLEAPIDLIVVDGPPAPPASRYPAVPLLRDRLSADAVVYLDDATRREARRNLERWSSRPSVEVEMLETEKGAAVIRGLGGGEDAGR
ncbi:MAG: class I SAM-dependent methyltransferase [Gemmatimonadota bacterium]|nr:class I SAM-dependent methyltransferase [Gemmatimonadota bacterium]